MCGTVLYHESLGRAHAPSIVILHGLLGNSRNWQRVTRLLENDFHVHTLDLRNHGKSPHAEPMTYAAMAEDVEAWLSSHCSGPVHLMGHSMGGKVAMTVACRAPERVSSLVVVDIAPKVYAPRWRAEFAAMRAIDAGALQSRGEAEEALEAAVPDWAFRKFLLTNLERCKEGGFRWIVNLPVLEAALPELFAHPLGDAEQYNGLTLFIRGARSKYINDSDIDRVHAHFPAGNLRTVPDAGHNVHFDQPELFVELVTAFCLGAG